MSDPTSNARAAKVKAAYDRAALEREAHEFFKRRRVEERKRLLISGLVFVGLGGSIAGALLSVGELTKALPLGRLSITSGRSAFEVEELRGQVAGLGKDLRLVQAKYDKALLQLSARPSENLGRDVSEDLKALDERLARIEKSISTDPERALSIPLMRKDVDSAAARFAEFQTRTTADIQQMTATVNTIFWALLSAMGVLIVSGGGLLLRYFWKGGVKGTEADES